MKYKHKQAPLLGVLAAVIAIGLDEAHGEVRFEPTWSAPSYNAVREQILDWLDQTLLDDGVVADVRERWPKEPEAVYSPLDRVADSIAAVDPQVSELIMSCRRPFEGAPPPSIEWLEKADYSELVSNNLRLLLGRWLAQHSFYDEAVEVLSGLQTGDVVDPAALLFYRMVAYHQLVQPERSRTELAKLLERESELPLRYQQIAQLVQRDLAALEDESLDHIARRMSDVRRRLEHGRAGERVQTVERGVVESLDKMIDQLEQQKQQQQQQQQSQSSGAPQSGQPMQDSSLPSMKAPGDVDQRNIGNKSGWGDLPPKQREQALQQIGREFPAHYRDVIEQYFRELASEGTDSQR